MLTHSPATPSPENPAVYLVGGSLRDAMLGMDAKDRDHVVVGCSPQHLLDAGFLPVGKDFPVFLHPRTHVEVALARTERKVAAGYHGFSFQAAPDVSIEADLSRRDLTVNAMALRLPSYGAFDVVKIIDAASAWPVAHLMARARPGDWVDPFGGQADLAAKVLRHVTPAFAEDPVRVLRLARFAARLTQFDVAPATMKLMGMMVEQGEVNALVAERVWQELSRGLMAEAPSRMLQVLRGCGALKRLMPEVDALWGVPQPPAHHPEVDTGVHLCLVLDEAARANACLAVRFAALCHDLGKGTTRPDEWPRHHGHGERSVKLLQNLCNRFKVPQDCRELAEVVAKEHGNIHASAELGAAALVRLLTRCDAFRRPQRFEQVLLACECDARGRTGLRDRPYPQRPRLLRCLHAAASVDAKMIATSSINSLANPEKDAKNMATELGGRASGERIKQAVADARVRAVDAALAGFVAD